MTNIESSWAAHIPSQLDLPLKVVVGTGRAMCTALRLLESS